MSTLLRGGVDIPQATLPLTLSQLLGDHVEALRVLKRFSERSPQGMGDVVDELGAAINHLKVAAEYAKAEEEDTE